MTILAALLNATRLLEQARWGCTGADIRAVIWELEHTPGVDLDRPISEESYRETASAFDLRTIATGERGDR